MKPNGPKSAPKRTAAVVLMVLSWIVIPHRRAELAGFAALIAVGVIGLAAGLTITHKLAMIGMMMMLVLATRCGSSGMRACVCG